MNNDKIIETYNPPLRRWRVWNGIKEVRLFAKVLLDGATVPIGKFRERDGKVFFQSLGDFHDTEHAAILCSIAEHESGMARTGEEIETLTRKLADLRIAHAALVKRLA